MPVEYQGRKLIKRYIDSQTIKVVEKFDIQNNSVEYSDTVKKNREITDLVTKKEAGQEISEEMTRAYILTKLCNELGYKQDRIEIEKTYTAGRPHTLTSRIDVIVKDKNDILAIDKDLIEIFGRVNVWWVFGEVAKEIEYPIFMAEADNIGYKRTKRSENIMPNDLYHTDTYGNIVIDIESPKTVLDYMRREKIWE